MPLILLPPLVLLPPSHEFVAIETSFQALTRPPLSTHSSYSSSSTACSSKNSQRRAYRPSLTPEELRAHAFGPRLRVREAVNEPVVPPTRSRTSSSLECSSFRSPMSESRRKRYNLPSPPPRGTFRSATLTAESLRQTRDHSSLRHEQDCVVRVSEGTVVREPPMPPDRWRQKADERLERRRLWRLRVALEESGAGVQPLPLDIDCRPMEGSMRLPPPSDMPRIRQGRARNASADSGMTLRNQTVREESPAGSERTAKSSLDRSRSMVEMNEINELAELCDELYLGSSTAVPVPKQVYIFPSSFAA